MNALSERVNSLLSNYLKLSFAFLCLLLLLRLYEYVIVSTAFVLPDSALLLYFTGALFDITYFSFLVLVIGILYFLIALIHEKTALWISGIMMSVFLIIYVGLIQYFGEVLVPLGADFFAYDVVEVSDTINTSVDITFSRVLPLFAAPALFYLIFYGLTNINISEKVTVIGLSGILILNVVYFVLYPAQDNYEREIDYQLVANKASVFFGQAKSILFVTDEISTHSGEEYPLLRPVADKDPLGQYLTQSDRPPNVVMIIVESLGAAVMPPHGRYKGFTPYLESLSEKSLNWTNFLATSGRSFNAHPTILGSLPYGERGFMDMGIDAPDHHSLISILNQNHYHTAYYCGYNSRFDNLDQFLERQQINLLMDESHFGDEYQKMDEIEGGFTWGYSDKDTFGRAFDYIDGMSTDQPRLDIFFTLNFHEPFIIPEPEKYSRMFHERLDEMDVSSDLENEFLRYEEIFSALLYTDSAIKELMERYQKRDDYEDTIFVITGDHRMIPVPHSSRIDRYHVPFMIYSPLLNSSKEIQGVSSHHDVTPSLLSFLSKNHQIEMPDQVHWLGGALNMSSEFQSEKTIPLMRNKNQMEDFLSGNHFLTGGQLFQINDGMQLKAVQDRNKRSDVQQKYQDFRSVNRYVTEQNKIIPVDEKMRMDREQRAVEINFLEEMNLADLNIEELYFEARDYAFSQEYTNARNILRYLLRQSPNYHDARLLYGRTYGWDGDYEKAEEEFRDVINRNDRIVEAYSAIADLYFWQGKPDETINVVERGMEIDETAEPLIFRKARAYNQKGDRERAGQIVDDGLRLHPGSENLNTLNNQLR